MRAYIIVGAACTYVAAMSYNVSAAVIHNQSFFNVSDTTIDFETFPSVSGNVPGGTAITNQYEIF